MDSLQKTTPEASAANLASPADAERSANYALISLRWRKAWRDLWLHKTRSILVILSIAVGIFAFGLILGARETLTTELRRHYLAVAPASATLHLTPFEEDLVESIQHMPQVAVAQGRSNTIVRYRDIEGKWHDMQLLAQEEYEGSDINIIYPVAGAWPPPEREILIERNSLFLTGATIGDILLLQTGDGQQRPLRITGLVHDMNQLPAQITGIPYGYVTRDTIEWLGLPRSYNELQIVVAEDRFDKDHIIQVSEAVVDKAERAGAFVFWNDVPAPGRHLAEEFLPTIVLILTFLGLLALLLSGLLVVNVVNAILAQQRRQIGSMKTIGARPAQISSIYLRLILLFGLVSLGIAIPLSTLGAGAFSRFIAGQLNFDLDQYRLPSAVLILEVLVGLLVPILAALHPVRSSARITIREAIQDYGLAPGSYGGTPLDRFLVKVQSHLPLSQPMRISIRNTFRQKGRLVRTLITLVLGGAIFMTVLIVRASLFKTLEETLSKQGYDVQIQLNRPYREARIQREVDQVPGVSALESWQMRQAILLQGDGTDAEDLLVFALPADTDLFVPDIVNGRWLTVRDEDAIIAPISLVRDRLEVGLGAEITLRIAGEETEWQVVGINESFQPPVAPPTVYVSQPAFARLMASYGRTDVIRLKIDPSSGFSDRQIGQLVEERLQAAGMEIRSTRSASEDREIFTERFNIITVILFVMAFLMATVGTLGLMGTMSINVLERTREIGVMRAIGASDGSVLRIFIAEGVLIGILSWVGALILSQPMSRLMSHRVGMSFLQLPLTYRYNWLAPALWLLIVIVISALASLLPAYNAAQLSVRETLTYE